MASRCLIKPFVTRSVNSNSMTWKPLTALSLSSAWNVIRLYSPVVEYFGVHWFPSCCPKMSVCMLWALNNKLLTYNILVKRHIHVTNTICTLWGREEENSKHMFFECSSSYYIWMLCRLKLGLPPSQIETLHDEAMLINNAFKGPVKITVVARMTICTVVWHIWHERNSIIFQNEIKIKYAMFRDIYEDI